jgi:hypothetical protein
MLYEKRVKTTKKKPEFLEIKYFLNKYFMNS